MENTYVITSALGHKLSGFYPNDCKNKLAFRRSDWYSFPTIEEAQSHLEYIQSHGVGKKLQIRTYGLKLS
jgi:hypothetical protein